MEEPETTALYNSPAENHAPADKEHCTPPSSSTFINFLIVREAGLPSKAATGVVRCPQFQLFLYALS